MSFFSNILVTADYRYGFQGQETDDEVKNEGNSYDFGNRIHDPRVGRFLSIDKYANKFAHQSPYVFAGNTPIMARDINGDSTWVSVMDWVWDSEGEEQLYKAVDRFLITDKLSNARVEILKIDLDDLGDMSSSSNEQLSYQMRLNADVVYDLEGLSQWSDKYSTENGEASSYLYLANKTLEVNGEEKSYFQVTVNEDATRLFAGRGCDLLFFHERAVGVIHTHPLNNITSSAVTPSVGDKDPELRYKENGYMDIIGYGKFLKFYSGSHKDGDEGNYMDGGNDMQEMMDQDVKNNQSSGTYDNYLEK